MENERHFNTLGIKALRNHGSHAFSGKTCLLLSQRKLWILGFLSEGKENSFLFLQNLIKCFI